jgi:RHS repeat-associated protein
MIMKKYILFIFSLLVAQVATAQTLATAPLTMANSSGEYYHPVSITLGDGFSTLPGGTFRAYIAQSPLANCIPLAAVLSQNQNYIVTYTPRVPFLATEDLTAKNTCEVMQTVKYFDGLGRPSQILQVKGNPDANRDLVQLFSYDEYGREVKKHLPYTSESGDGSFKVNAEELGSGVFNFYNPAGSSGSQLSNGIPRIATPFAESRFEVSPLNRPIEQGAAGDAWQLSQGHTVKTAYSTNAPNEVMWYSVNPVSGAEYKKTIGYGAAYDVNTLFKTVSKDENWQVSDGLAGTTEEFKDKEGHVVLKRIYNKKDDGQIEGLATGYVYDDYGNLSFVLPPHSYGIPGQSLPPGTFPQPSQQQLDEVAYQYRYDSKNRLIEKKIPGKGWEYLVYNEFDQLVMSQDALQRDHNNQDWVVNKYDKFGRQVVTGIYKHAGSTAGTDYRATIQANVDAAPPGSNPRWETYTGEGDGYTASGSYNSFPLALNSLLMVNYYDSYTFPGASGLLSQGVVSAMTKGLVTGTKTYTTDGAAAYLAVNYYDNEGRIIGTMSQNHVGGTDRLVNTYSFTNEMLTSTRTHIGHGQTTSIVNAYRYDHMGRKRETTESINNASPVILSKLTYNELGQLKDKELHSTNDGVSFLNKSSYTYNARGWLQGQVNPLFNMGLKYEDVAAPQYNGNISRQEWGPSAMPAMHNYTYVYDKLNRLKSGTSDEGFNENLVYDARGNIASLSRNPMGINSYIYNGNHLESISGFVNGSYQYDVNGNMKLDGPKNITIEYNYLNLPVSISKPGELMRNTFLANGAKLKKTVGGLTREYARGIEYSDGNIEFIQTEEGRARPNGGSYFYEYMLKDHLGNTRLMLDQNGTVLESSDYYPFGLQVARTGSTVPSPENNYKYNGKELQTELGLMQYDYGARFYDPVIGRWTRIDNKAEAFEAVSPYIYAVNDPVNAIDPDGNLIIFVNGFVPGDWARQNNRKTQMPNGTFISNSRPYPPSRNLTNNSPQYLGKSFDYWGNIDNAFMQGYKDDHAMYINGSSDNSSEAADRFAEGETAGNSLISKLENGDISLSENEKIKIVGHSQGGAFAAGMASVLSKNKKYASVLQEVVYLEPHQPADFNNPYGVKALQISSPADVVASKDSYTWGHGQISIPLGWLKGKTSFSRIRGISQFISNGTHNDDSLRGHSVGTNLDEIISYFRGKGVTVNVK